MHALPRIGETSTNKKWFCIVIYYSLIVSKGSEEKLQFGFFNMESLPLQPFRTGSSLFI